jgi:MFS family permease
MPESTTVPVPTFPAGVRRLPRAAAFVAVIAIMVLFQAASSALTPLFVIYQRLWGFSSAIITLVFAVFVVGLLAALLTLGALSDYVGRRPVLLTSLALQAVALVLFLTATDVAALLIARAVQGVATGMVLPTLGAMLVDFDPPDAPGRATIASGVVPIGGLAVGSLGCGALAQYAPDPAHLVWAMLLGATAIALIVALTFAESSPGRSGVLRSFVPRLGIPRLLRSDVLALVPVIVASWALGGLYLSLGPSAAATVFGIADHFVGGLVATLLCGAGAVTAFTLRRSSDIVVRRSSAALLAIGTAVTLLGTITGSVMAAVVGTVVAGIGYGAAGLATFGQIATLAEPVDPAERGELFAVAYAVAYLSFSLPALGAGYLTTLVSLRDTVLVYAGVVILVGLVALVVQEVRASGERDSGAKRTSS